jgi:hypothetical protein
MSCSYRYRYHDRKGEGKKGKRNQVIKKSPREQAECCQVGKARGEGEEGRARLDNEQEKESTRI